MMKKLLIIGSMFAVSVLADPCAEVYEIAKSVMQLRQAEAPINLVIKAGPKNMVIDAYSQPARMTPEYKNESVNKFANKYALRCYE